MMIIIKDTMFLILPLFPMLADLDNDIQMMIYFTGLVTEEIFYSIFSKFFPLGGDTYSGGQFTMIWAESQRRRNMHLKTHYYSSMETTIQLDNSNVCV